MRKMLVSAALGGALAVLALAVMDTVNNVQTAARFAQAQQEAPSDWLLVEGFASPAVIYPVEPSLRFVGTPSRDLLIRLAVSSRNSETGDVLCSGGGSTVLYEAGVPIPVHARVSTLAGLDACDWPVGRYRVRLTFLMTEPDSQIAKTLLIETDDIEVMAAETVR